MQPIVIASPHSRNDSLELRVRDGLGARKVIRIRSPNELLLEKLEALNPAWIFFPHWSWIIPKEIYTRFNCIIFHMTDLPYGRGGSPLQNLIIRGHKETMLSAIGCDSELDAGPIYLKRPLSLLGTAEEILSHASDLIVSMILEIIQEAPTPLPQSGEVVQFSRREPKDGNLFELNSLVQIYDFIRMLDGEGYPSAFINTAHMHIEFVDAVLADEYVEAKVRIRRAHE